MKSNAEVKTSKLIASAFAAFLCYLILIAILCIFMAADRRMDIVEYFTEYYNDFIALCIFTFFLFALVYFYYFFEDRAFLSGLKNIFLVASVIDFSVIVCVLLGRYVNIYARPAAMLALFFVYLLGPAKAVFLNFVFSALLLTTDITMTGYFNFTVEDILCSALMMGFLCGTVSVFLAGRVKTRGGLLLTGVLIAAPAAVMLLLVQIPLLRQAGWLRYLVTVGYGVLGCVISAVLALAVLPVFERVFNCLTAFRLRELASTNSPLLARLKTEAPGTFNHSLVVAQLAEASAYAIGEDAELARAVAYYHDVGKLKQPDCFTENQGDYNIHDELTPELSADIIRSHAKDGYDLLTSSHMPQIFADVAREHHGTMPIKFFYAKALKISGGDADMKEYSYLGPTPSTKIAAIIMIADASEAAVRSMKDRTDEHVEKIVRSIIEERMDLDQFANCDVTMRELTVIKQALVEALSGVHHRRVEYPAIRIKREQKAIEEEEEKS